MRLADYVMQFLAGRGVTHAFLVTGGGAMHLNDAIGRETRFKWICNHHEQACAMAAESYARLSNRMALVNVTTGPGGINALNGVYGAYVDSIPMFVVSGQVKRETVAGNTGLPLRQLGDQEVDIASMVRPITKYVWCVQDPGSIRYHLEKAFYLATCGRPGPVWLDIPIDVQSARIEPESLTRFSPQSETADLPGETGRLTGPAVAAEAEYFLQKLNTAARPVIFAGAGVRIAGVRAQFLRLAEKLGVPVVTGWNAHDLLPNSHPCYAGRPGTVGDRQGNFTVQNSDLLLILGSRLNIRQISYNWKSFARVAYKIMVDIDAAELRKPTLMIDRPVHADVATFLDEVESAIKGGCGGSDHSGWLAWCRRLGEKYPVVLPEYEQQLESINPYVFVKELFNALADDEIVVTGDGTACVTAFQAAVIKSGTRLYTNSGCASMGYDLPAAIGAYHAAGKRVICIAGDGSIMMNLQELQTIAGLRLPIKIFVLNNGGYHSIRQTQQNYFPGHEIGVGSDSGVTFPDFLKVAEAFGIPSRRCGSMVELRDGISLAMIEVGPILVEVMLDIRQGFSPKPASRAMADGSMASSALEDMAPFLPRDELAANMVIPLAD
jgi:acetolactate synthase-1/2/3 large subunit